MIDWIAVEHAATLQLHKMTHIDPQLLVPGGRFATLAMDRYNYSVERLTLALRRDEKVRCRT
jgi:uncharacterized membrane protein YcaP (DUF421 family)